MLFLLIDVKSTNGADSAIKKTLILRRALQDKKKKKGEMQSNGSVEHTENGVEKPGWTVSALLKFTFYLFIIIVQVLFFFHWSIRYNFEGQYYFV